MSESPGEWSEWWAAGSPEHRTTGEIAFDETSGVALTLYGILPGVTGVEFRSPPMHGETFDGEPLTVPSAAILGTSQNLGAGLPRARTRLRASTLLRGCHADPDTLVVDRAVVRLTGLRDVCLRPWLLEPSTFMVEARKVTVAGGSLTFRQSIEKHHPSQFAESSELDVDILIEIAEPLSLADFEDRWVSPLEAMILFAARAPVGRKGFTLILNDPDAGASVDPAISHGTSPEMWSETHVDVLTEIPSLSTKPPARYDRLLVPFNSLGDRAEEFIGRWWDLYAELGTAAVFLMSALGSELYLEHRLLTLMSFVEGYHRQKHDEPKVPAEEHETNVAKMLGVIEDDAQRDHYQQTLRFAGAQTARQRLKALVQRAHQTLPDVARLNAQLASDLVDTRNALTHLDPSGNPGLQGVDLVYAVARLELVIQTNLLLDLHLGSVKVAELVLTSYHDRMPVRDFSVEAES
jgi:hypothetical protein